LKLSTSKPSQLGSAMIGAPHIDEPNWTIAIDGTPSLKCQLCLTGSEEADPAAAVNAARAVNFIPELIAGNPGWVSVLDVPAPRGRLAH
jgi:4-hydroxy-tetrahydrodipicolinate reductase